MQSGSSQCTWSAPKAAQARVHKLGDVVRIGHSFDALDHLHAGAQLLELVDQALLWVTDNEIVAPFGEDHGQRRPDIERGVVDEGDSA